MASRQAPAQRRRTSSAAASSAPCSRSDSDGRGLRQPGLADEAAQGRAGGEHLGAAAPPAVAGGPCPLECEVAQLAGVAAPAQHRALHRHRPADAGPDREQHDMVDRGRGADRQLCEQCHVGVVLEDDGSVDGLLDDLTQARSGEVHEARGQDRRGVTVESPRDADADRLHVVVQQLPAQVADELRNARRRGRRHLDALAHAAIPPDTRRTDVGAADVDPHGHGVVGWSVRHGRESAMRALRQGRPRPRGVGALPPRAGAARSPRGRPAGSPSTVICRRWRRRRPRRARSAGS